MPVGAAVLDNSMLSYLIVYIHIEQSRSPPFFNYYLRALSSWTDDWGGGGGGGGGGLMGAVFP